MITPSDMYVIPSESSPHVVVPRGFNLYNYLRTQRMHTGTVRRL